MGLKSSLDALRRRPHWIVAIGDAVAAALLILAVFVEQSDGFRLTILGTRLSVRSTWRIVVWALIVVAVRHVVVPRPPIWARAWDWQAAAEERRASGDAPATLSIRQRLLIAALLTVPVLILLGPMLAHPFSVPDHGDPLFSIWRLSWIAHQVPRDPLHLFDANMFHPNPRPLAYSDAMLVPGLVAAPFVWLGVPGVLVYNLLFVAAIVASGVTMFLLVRGLTHRTDAAVVSGLLFATCAFRFLHISHLELQVTVWMPLTLHWLHRTLLTGRLRDGLLTGLAMGLQGLSSLYYGLFLSTFVGAITLALCLLRHASLTRLLRPLGAGALVTLAMVGPYSVAYWQARADVGERTIAESLSYSATPADYLAPHGSSVYAGLASGPAGERSLFPGVMPLVLASAGLWPPLSPIRLAYGVGLAVAVDASLGFNSWVYPLLFRYVPGFHGLRAPARFGMIVALALSILGGYGVLRIAGRVRNTSTRRTVVTGLALLALAEARPTVRLDPLWTRPPDVYASLPADRTAVLVDLPFPSRQSLVGEESRYIYFSTFHWHRLINGFSGSYPPDYLRVREALYDFPSPASLTALRARGAEFMVLHGMFYEPHEYVRVTTELAAREGVTLLTTSSWEGSEVRLYRLD